MNVLAVFIGGGLGSLCRYGLGLFFARTNVTDFPLATFISNLAACLVLALTLVFFKEKISQLPWLAPLVITGFCGGFSTFSTFSFETAGLIQQGNYFWAAGNIIVSLAAGIGMFMWMKIP